MDSQLPRHVCQFIGRELPLDPVPHRLETWAVPQDMLNTGIRLITKQALRRLHKPGTKGLLLAPKGPAVGGTQKCLVGIRELASTSK
eukprot:15461509-Alexandrium_andersonii.AAC.1